MRGWALNHQPQLVQVINGHFEDKYLDDVGKDHVHVFANRIEGSQKADDLDLRSIYAERFDRELIQGLEIDFGDRCVCPRAPHIDEKFEGILCDDDLINYDRRKSVRG